MVELARALDTDPDLLILDEITQSLSQDTRQVIYRLKDRFKKENRAMIIISHDLDETLLISDTVTVLRDGVVVDTVERKNITEESLKQMEEHLQHAIDAARRGGITKDEVRETLDLLWEES